MLVLFAPAYYRAFGEAVYGSMLGETLPGFDGQ
jgi:hypothetical protein